MTILSNAFHIVLELGESDKMKCILFLNKEVGQNGQLRDMFMGLIKKGKILRQDKYSSFIYM